jgi:hypothetical protein
MTQSDTQQEKSEDKWLQKLMIIVFFFPHEAGILP